MEVKILKSGFSEAEFNEFASSHIVYKFQLTEKGDMHIFYKDPKKIGNDLMENIEQLDRLTKQAENETLAAELDMRQAETQLADLKEKFSRMNPKMKEYDFTDARIKETEKQIKMHKATIAERTEQIVGFHTKKDELLGNSKPVAPKASKGKK